MRPRVERVQTSERLPTPESKMLRGTLATNLIPGPRIAPNLAPSRSFGGLVRAGYLREWEQRLLYLLVPSASSGSVRGGLAL